MNSSKELKSQFQTVSTVEEITTVYQGIASLHMNQIKDTVAKTKEFIDGLADIYHEARTAYIAEIQLKSKSKKNGKLDISPIIRNGKNLTVFISANEHLYGSLIIDTAKKFFADIKANPTDAVIIGRFGRSLAERENLNIFDKNKGGKYELFYFDLDDNRPNLEAVHKIINFVTQYEQIVVHYGSMRTLLTQEPMRSEITGKVVLSKPIGNSQRYLFEPSAVEIMKFFESEIIASVFNEKILENQLARFSSRMVAMDQASQNAEELLKFLKSDMSRTKKRVNNVKQLEVFSGSSNWRKNGR